MKFTPVHFSREGRYSLGIEQDTDRRYLAIPVTSRIADYEEYYELTADEYERFLADGGVATAFADECRERRNDERLIRKPGWNRGIPL
ncbi:hypothetical protein [Agromyces larvae]|uniref:Uncharacterized protein n=1 Tax=Agromyces larvae TaxID=2929802 RepID=A0ABY4C4I0_9MICO|nr:hypothetical protein [Agromyces larvae]UOE44981.1 hypothetical protein MTO99_04150 [Agromyces larvae]